MTAYLIDPGLTSQFPFKSPSFEDQSIMQYRLFMVLAAACFFGSCDLVAASVNKDAMVRKTDAVASTKDHLVYGNGGRLLRTGAVGSNGRYEKLEGEDRRNAVLDSLKSLFKTKKAPDLKRTFPSPPVADKLVRSKSLLSKKAKPMAKTLKRSESATFALTLEQIAERGKSAFLKDLERIYKMKKNPDDIVDFFKLDTKLLSKKGTTLKQLEKASNGSGKRWGEYKLWHAYSKFYKRRNRDWVSKWPKRTFPSSPVADKLVRSKSLPSKKAAPMADTLKRSESVVLN
ncbi:unnamed protein product [Phytophthora fragariaefolia]|uniref:Unnamed protein product n=1 Tax=Phytophthora fragariaefolia TaxID=1490495 RepID=A0A9W6Y642_9STRA|nr:unnamed protein product [Phytophthora fragariaefolia]